MTHALHRLLLFLPAAAVGCSLLALDNYDVSQCTVEAGTPAANPCRSLCVDGLCVGCLVYQCNPTSHRCELSAVDNDGDGDPSIACGGHDCDDDKPTVSSTHAEICDRLDNNCNGLVDEDVIDVTSSTSIGNTYQATMASVVADDPALLASFVVPRGDGGTCIAVASDQASAAVSSCVPFPVDPGVPINPYTRVIGMGYPPNVVTVYTRHDRCDGLALRSMSGAAIDPVCADGPATHPSFMRLDDGANAIVAYYAAAPTTTCADAKPSALMLRRLRGVNTSTPTLLDPIALSSSSTAIRAAPFSFTGQADRTLVAAPDDVDGAALWLVTLDAITRVQLGAGLAGARSVDVTAETVNGVPHLGIVAEIGCPPNQRVVAMTGTASFDATPPTVSLSAAIPVATGGSDLASPSIAWNVDYGEFRVTYVADGKLSIQRLLADGTKIGGPLVPTKWTVGRTVAAAQGLTLGNIVVVPEGADAASASELETLTLGCRQ